MLTAAVAIPEKLFFKIGEVCDIVGVQAHVLRYWETEFPMFSPQKNRAGQRTYRKRDVEIAWRIKELLYEELYTIAGARKRLSHELRGAAKLKVVSTEPAVPLETPVFAEPETGDEFVPGSMDFSQSPIDLNDSSGWSDAAFTADSSPWTEDHMHAIRKLAQELREVLELLKQETGETKFNGNG